MAVYGSEVNTRTCVGFIFSHISGQDRTAEWKYQHNFGLYPTHINKYGPASRFKHVSKLWRLGGKPKMALVHGIMQPLQWSGIKFSLFSDMLGSLLESRQFSGSFSLTGCM